MSNQWYEKFKVLANDFEQYKLDHQTPGEQRRTAKPV